MFSREAHGPLWKPTAPLWTATGSNVEAASAGKPALQVPSSPLWKPTGSAVGTKPAIYTGL